jgi:hypothetical protein
MQSGSALGAFAGAAANVSDAATINVDSMKRADAAGAPSSAAPTPPDAGRVPIPAQDRQDAGMDAAISAAPGTTDAAVPARDAAIGVMETRCAPGIYTGQFNGSIQLVGLALSSVTGTIRAELKLDAGKQHLAIQDARVIGVDQDGNSLDVALTGSVDCATFRLDDGRLDHGIYRNTVSGVEQTFNGDVQGTYSQAPSSVLGTWLVETTDTSLLGGRGTWTILLSEQRAP